MQLHEIMTCMVVLMGSPGYIKNLFSLSSQCALMQEYFVDDLCELILYVGQIFPRPWRDCSCRRS